MLATDEKAFDANYNNQIADENRSAEELAADEKRQQELRIGKITKPDGTIITFVPIGTVKQRIRLKLFPGAFIQPVQTDRGHLENLFDKVKGSEGLDKAIDGYRKLLNNPFLVIKGEPTLRLENLGDKSLRENRYAEAIKIYQLNVETNPEWGRAYFKLAQAYESRLGVEPQARENAIKNYELVLTTKIASKQLRDNASERLKVLRGQG